jgi:polyhydroxyalkanoate synthesis regulator phasin
MDLKEQAEKARVLYNAGEISREEAKELIQPYLDQVNAKSKELAIKYNQKPKKVDFGYYVR